LFTHPKLDRPSAPSLEEAPNCGTPANCRRGRGVEKEGARKIVSVARCSEFQKLGRRAPLPSLDLRACEYFPRDRETMPRDKPLQVIAKQNGATAEAVGAACTACVRFPEVYAVRKYYSAR
jgi:hypothetical protein